MPINSKDLKKADELIDKKAQFVRKEEMVPVSQVKQRINVTVEIPEFEYKHFKARLVEQGKTIKEVVGDFIRTYQPTS